MYKSKYKKASSRIARRSKIKSYFNIFVRVAIPVGILITTVFLARADFLQVKGFEVVGAESLGQAEITKISQDFVSGNKLLFVPKSNIIFLNKDGLASALLADFTRIQEVKINKRFWSKQIELKVSEREPEFLWCSSADICYLMSRDGLVFDRAADTLEISGKIIFRGIIAGDPILKNFASAEEMQNYIKLLEVFRGNGVEIGTINMESDDKAVAQSGIGDIIFNPGESDLTTVAQNTVLLVNEVKAKTPSARFLYIDARFGNKIFYKLI